MTIISYTKAGNGLYGFHIIKYNGDLYDRVDKEEPRWYLQQSPSRKLNEIILEKRFQALLREEKLKRILK